MKYYFIDLFCGAGGTSTGINRSQLRTRNIAEVFTCINHDANAIASHKANHPEAIHYVEDIRTVSLVAIIKRVWEIRDADPNAVICLWASLECTNHSNAKGGMSRDADSRTLANHLFRYVEELGPMLDMVWIENVREFKDWGPLMHKVVRGRLQYIKKGKNKGQPVMVPIKALKETEYQPWVDEMKSYGFNYDMKILNCADYGCETSRRRLFIQFARPHIDIIWPEQTHDKKGKNGLPLWKPVRPLLRLDVPGESLFDRKKPFEENSLERFYEGLVRYCGETYIAKYYSSGGQWNSLDEPSATLTTKDRLAIVKSEFLQYDYGTAVYKGLDEPAPTLTVNPKANIVTGEFIVSNYRTQAAKTLEEPCPTLVANPKQQLVSANFLIDKQYKNPGTSIDKPCPTLLATENKKPKYLVTAEGYLKDYKGPLPPKIKRGDSPATKKIKKFMQKYGIVDVKVRGLLIEEMLLITGFPADYILIGTKTEQKKFIGNAVPCKMVNSLVKASVLGNIKRKKVKVKELAECL